MWIKWRHTLSRVTEYCLWKVSFVISKARLSPFLKLCLYMKALPVLSAMCLTVSLLYPLRIKIMFFWDVLLCSLKVGTNASEKTGCHDKSSHPTKSHYLNHRDRANLKPPIMKMLKISWLLYRTYPRMWPLSLTGLFGIKTSSIRLHLWKEITIISTSSTFFFSMQTPFHSAVLHTILAFSFNVLNRCTCSIWCYSHFNPTCFGTTNHLQGVQTKLETFGHALQYT